MRKSFILFFTSVMLLPGALVGQSIQNAIESFAADPLLKHAGISFMVMDMNSKEVLGSYNPDLALSPASTMKLVTTATSLEILGPGYRFETKVYTDGMIDSAGILHGNVIVEGGGDPTLGSKYYEKHYFSEHFMHQWIQAIQSKGIQRIEGRIIGDDRVFTRNTVPGGWSWSDIGNYFGAGAAGLSVFDNMVKLYFRSGPNHGDPTKLARMDPYIPEYQIDNHVTSSNVNADNAYIYGGLYSSNYMAYGTVPKGRSEFEVKASMPDPAFACAWYLDSLMRVEGIEITHSPSTSRRILIAGDSISDKKDWSLVHTANSPYLSSIIWWTNMVSVNLFAEGILSMMGRVKFGDGSTYSGGAAVEKFWTSKGLDMSGLHVNDGSGLSRSNAISAKHFVQILTWMNASKHSNTFKESLPVAGVSGTLAGWCKGTKAANNLRAKSGSMTRVKSHAGYVTSASGRALAFAIVINNYEATGYQLKTRLEKLFSVMAGYSG